MPKTIGKLMSLPLPLSNVYLLCPLYCTLSYCRTVFQDEAVHCVVVGLRAKSIVRTGINIEGTQIQRYKKSTITYSSLHVVANRPVCNIGG